jgi:drug/metabolite transporter (DMT)-like permease
MRWSKAFFRSPEGQGILLMLVATFTFATLDTITKHTITLVPVLMLLWFSYAFQATFTFTLRARAQGFKIFITANPRLQLARGSLAGVSSLCSFYSLQHLPVAEFTSIAMLSPMAATALAAVTLKNYVSPRRWAWMGLGLVGAMLVVRPGGQIFGWAVLLPMLMVSAFAGFQVITSRLSGEESPYTTHFYTGLVTSVGLLPVVMFVWDSAALLTYWPWFVTVGLLRTFGHLMLLRAYSRASAVVISPYQYSQLAFATLAGWVVFGHTPDAVAWLGIATIAASGVGNGLVTMQEAGLKRQ